VARVFASRCRTRLGAAWGLAELGIAGPTPSPYGGPAGVAVLAVDGPVSRARRLETGHADRAGNMRAFAEALLALLSDALDAASPDDSVREPPPRDGGA
jgi:nicotinamide mononucleotide (NMN) deamidase PncC